MKDNVVTEPKDMKYPAPEGYEPWPKRYLVFGYECYYPKGGWNDCQGVFRSLAEAKDFVSACPSGPRIPKAWRSEPPTVYGDYYQIVDLFTGAVIETNDEDDSARYILEKIDLSIIDAAAEEETVSPHDEPQQHSQQ